MDFFSVRYYKLSRALLIWMGLWPYQTFKQTFIQRFIVMIIMASCLTITIAKFITTKWSATLAAELLPFGIILVILYIKYFSSCISTKQLKELLNLIEKDWNGLDSKEELQILTKSAEEGRLFVLYIVLLVHAGLIFLIIFTLSPKFLDIIMPLNKSRSLQHPFAVEYFVDQQEYFFPILLHMYISSATGANVLLGTDALCIVYLQHASGLFKITGYRLEHAFDVDQIEIYNPNKNFRIYQKICESVKFHKKAVMFVSKINSCYEWQHLIVLVIGILSISISLFCTVLFIGEWKKMIMSGVCTSGQIIYLFIEIYPAQQLTNCSSSITYKAYASQWYLGPPKLQKLLLPIIRRGLVPSHLIAGRMCYISMEFYTKVLQTCISYFTALCSFR